ncbi:hypothetical protein [Roseinatronobacter sp. S2]|uniref:hypothetical protein n=1 Tax=Roseinatronobacter sp. S2 TaxID=3035471 RepID=UPI00240EE96C|nr:hypothetical protein [Roseinatronobacter sp. S2]WFE76060.1 hypothetical protein P8S53_06575 [Roseinatronobacter sp. S2]
MMTEIIGSKDCGNSPRNRFAQHVAITLETGRIEAGTVSDAVIWQRPTGAVVQGFVALDQALAGGTACKSVTVGHAISHGRTGMACGETVLSDGTRRRFCHVFEYTNTKGNCVAVIKTYT